MSGIYITGIDMPRKGESGRIAILLGSDDVADVYRATDAHLEHFVCECKAIPVPAHGDLIDRQAFRYEMDKHYPFDNATQRRHGIEDVLKSAVLRMLFDAPTIIPASPADKEGEG